MKLLKNKFLLPSILLLLSIFFISIYMLPAEPYDELWNFQNTYKIYNNYQIYSDANIIITPLFYILGLGFLKLFGATLIAFRYYNILIFVLFFALLYMIFKKLNVSKHLNFLFLIICFIQIYSVINGGANYNALYINFIFLGILSYLYLSEKKYFSFLQGLLIFLVFFTKQNMGIYYFLATIVYEFIYRKNFKIFFINQIKKISIFIVLSTIICLYFYLDNNLLNFLNYTFGGLLNFGNSNFSFSVSPYLLMTCLSILIIYFNLLFNKKIFPETVITPERKKNINLLGIIAISSNFSVFPILNTAHFLYIIPFYFMILFYFLDFAILEDLFSDSKSNIYIYLIILIVLFGVLARMSFTIISPEKPVNRITDKTSPFYSIYFEEENYEKINTMTSYIKEKNIEGKEVIIITSDACLSMIPLNKSNRAFDLPFKGNLGYNGENKIIKQIKDSKNTEFLIYTSEEDCFWQESEKIRNFITKNLVKTGEILNYSIYENK